MPICSQDIQVRRIHVTLISALHVRTQSPLLAQLANASYTGSPFVLWPATVTPLAARDLAGNAAMPIDLAVPSFRIPARLIG